MGFESSFGKWSKPRENEVKRLHGNPGIAGSSLVSGWMQTKGPFVTGAVCSAVLGHCAVQETRAMSVLVPPCV